MMQIFRCSRNRLNTLSNNYNINIAKNKNIISSKNILSKNKNINLNWN